MSIDTATATLVQTKTVKTGSAHHELEHLAWIARHGATKAESLAESGISVTGHPTRDQDAAMRHQMIHGHPTLSAPGPAVDLTYLPLPPGYIGGDTQWAVTDGHATVLGVYLDYACALRTGRHVVHVVAAPR